jgi:hypothetical protein
MPAGFDAVVLWRDTKFTACLAAATLAVALLAPHLFPRNVAFVVSGFALVVCAGAVWQCLLYGSTLTSQKLQGVQRQRFQVAVSLSVPLVLTLYFVYRSETIDPVAAGLLSWWLLLAPVVIAFASYKMSSELHSEHPFRGFIIAALVIFVWCFLKEQGVYFEGDNYDEGSSMYISKEKAEHARRTGEYVMRYTLYVVAAYTGLLAGRLRRV